MEKMAWMRKAVYKSEGGWGQNNGPIPLSLAAWEPLGSQPWSAQGARGCELPATITYYTADSTHMRQA